MPGGYGTMPGHLPQHMPQHLQNGHPGNALQQAGPNGMAMAPSQHHQPPTSIATSMHQQLPQLSHQQPPQSLPQQHQQHIPTSMMANLNTDPNLPPSSLHQMQPQQPQQQQPHGMQPQAPVSGAAPQPQPQPLANNNNPQYTMTSPGYFAPNFSGPPMPQLAPGQQPQQQQPQPMYLPHQQHAPPHHPSPQQQFQPQHHHQQLPINNGASPSHQMHMMAANMAAITQPVTNTILPPADSRANIPIYQQQR